MENIGRTEFLVYLLVLIGSVISLHHEDFEDEHGFNIEDSNDDLHDDLHETDFHPQSSNGHHLHSSIQVHSSILHSLTGGSSTQGACEPIKISLCMELGYNETTMPNLVGHEAQIDADALLQTFTPLIQYGCSPHLKLFLCSSHVPMCTEKTPQPIGPCRSLCESVKRRCEPVLTEFGFKWPPSLDCKKFYPENNHHHMCIPSPINENPFKNKEESLEKRLLHSKTKNPHERKIQLNPPNSSGDSSIQSPDGKNPKKCYSVTKLWTKGHCWTKCSIFQSKESYSTTIDRENIQLFINNDIDSKFARHYSLSWSILCFLVSILVIKIAISSKKVSRAERPLIYIAICQVMVSIGTIGATLVSSPCFHEKASGIELLAGHGIVPPFCAITFLLTYFFSIASILWWVILCLCWSFAISINMRIHLQQKERSLFHIFSWGMASILTSSALIHKKVEGDPLVGLCGVGFQDSEGGIFYLLIPLCCSLIVAVLSLGFGSIGRIFPNFIQPNHQRKGREATACQNHAYSPVLPPPPPFSTSFEESPTFFSSHPQSGRGRIAHQKKTQEQSKSAWRRIGVFAIVQIIPVTVQVVTVIYELKYRETWEGFPNLQTTLLRVNMGLISGLTAGVWVLSTLSWKESNCCCSFLKRFVPKSKMITTGSTSNSTVVAQQHSPSSATTTSPLLIPVPVNSLATSYITIGGGGTTTLSAHHSHLHHHHTSTQDPRTFSLGNTSSSRFHHPPSLPPPLPPQRNPPPITNDVWRRTETIV